MPLKQETGRRALDEVGAQVAAGDIGPSEAARLVLKQLVTRQ